jgi:hypothetical protein
VAGSEFRDLVRGLESITNKVGMIIKHAIEKCVIQ